MTVTGCLAQDVTDVGIAASECLVLLLLQLVKAKHA